MSAKPVILLVEDEALLVASVEDALIDAGYTIFSSLHGTAAMQEFDSEPHKFACLVTDIRLGGETDGWAVARHVREKNPGIPVIYMTGNASAEWDLHGVADSILLHKPFRLEVLTDAIIGMLNKTPPEGVIAASEHSSQSA